MNMTQFFGKDEWGAMFGASFVLVLITGFFLISRIIIWISFILFMIAFLFTGYKLFFDKKNKSKGNIKDFGDSMGTFFKK